MQNEAPWEEKEKESDSDEKTELKDVEENEEQTSKRRGRRRVKLRYLLNPNQAKCQTLLPAKVLEGFLTFELNPSLLKSKRNSFKR